MIPAVDTIVQTDELPSLEDIEFEIGDPRFVMMTQADLYSDRTRAVIREYSTNAWDAHVMAGNSDPIEVTLPSQMNEGMFIITDHGVGMDIADFKQNYTKFGNSNKRASTLTNGQLGYGSKSGLAFTTSFNVTSVKNGVKNEAVVVRRPDWSIVMKVLKTHKTDEPNGTVIKIPVPDADIPEFVHKANEFYQFWLPGRVLVNGQAPEHKVGKKIVDNLYYSEQWNTSYVVMGNVAYRIANPDHLFRNTKMNRINFVAYVDDLSARMGAQAVEFTPSREDLKYTERTKATLQKVVDEFEANIVKAAQDEIDGAKSHFEAFSLWSAWSSRLGRALFESLEFDGDAFQANFPVKGKRWKMGASRYSVETVRDYPVADMAHTMVVTDCYVEPSSNVKAKVREYRDLKGWHDVKRVLFVYGAADTIDSPWIPRDKFIKWEDLKAALPKKVKVPGQYYANTGRIAGSFDYYTRKGMEYEKSLPVTTDQLFYISVQDSKNIEVRQILNLLGMDNTVILLGANRIAKFKRENPSVQNFYTAMQDKVVTDGTVLLSKDAKDALDVSADLINWLDKLPTDQIKDPEFARVAGLRTNLKALTKEYDLNIALANSVGMRYNVKKYTSSEKSFGLLTKYPLLTEFAYWRVSAKAVKELVVYINAKHAASV